MNYFKLVALAGDPNWTLDEFKAGRARYGWSWFPGADLRILENRTTRTAEEAIVWRYCQSLVRRIEVGNRIVMQFEQPMRRFVIGEVKEPGYEFANDGYRNPDGSLDFRHVLHVRPLTPTLIPLDCVEVTAALRHDLTKPGNLYEIYPERSIRALQNLATRAANDELNLSERRSETHTLEETNEAIHRCTIKEISDQWPGKGFEKFVAHLCKNLPYVEVKERRDTRQGWDLLVSVRNPLTGEILQDGIPIQCKNYTGEVEDDRPIEDLVRCIRNSGSEVAILFILGDLTDEYRRRLDLRREELQRDIGRPVKFEVVDQDRIAEMYLAHLGSKLSGQSPPSEREDL